MGALDIAARGLLQAAPRDAVQWLLGPRVKVLGAWTEESQRVARERRVDKLFRVRVAGQRRNLRLHVEVAARWGSDVPRRTHESWTLCGGASGETISVVLVLRPGERQRREPREELVVTALGVPLMRFKFRVLRMWTVDAARLLRSGPRTLLPFLPYARGASSRQVRSAFERLKSEGRSTRRGELLSALAVFADHVFPDFDWLGMIPEEFTMERKNRVIEAWLARGRQLELADALSSQLRLRLGKRATRLARWAHAAKLRTLRKASRTIASTRDDEELVALLTGLLEPAKPRKAQPKKVLARS